MKEPVRTSRLVLQLVLAIVAASFEGRHALHAESLRYTDLPTSINLMEASKNIRADEPARFLTKPPIRMGWHLNSTATASPEGSPSVVSAGSPPLPVASFAAGIEGQGPPDTMGAVGPQHVMTVLNTGIRVQNRSGGVLAAIDTETFWSTSGIGLYDPRVVYDHFRSRWLVVEAYQDGPRNVAGFAVAVSRTSDPTGWWDRYTFPTSANEWIDYPMVGFNQQTVSIEAVSVPNSGAAGRVIIYVFDKNTLFAGGGAEIHYNYITAPAGLVAPVTVFDTDSTDVYFVQTLQFENSVRLLREAPGGLVEIARIQGPQSWSEVTPLMPQLGSSVRISPGDSRVWNVVLRNDALWFVEAVFLPATQPTRAAVQWWKLSLDGSLLDFGRIDDPSGAVSYCFGSVAVNRNNDVMIGFSQMSATTYPTAAYAVRSALDAPGTFRAPAILKGGEAAYGNARWGDYSATVVDPDDLTFWTVQEYAAKPAAGPRWGVWWGHVPSPVPPTGTPVAADFAFSPASPVVGQGVTFTDGSTGQPSIWAWNFGDGVTSAIQNPSHTYGTAGTFTVSLTASNGSSQSNKTKSVAVAAVASSPVISSFVGTPPSITPGQATTLTWTSIGGTSATIDQGVGSVPTSGSRVITPTISTTFTLSVTGAGGSAHNSVTVTVTDSTTTWILPSSARVLGMGGTFWSTDLNVMNPTNTTASIKLKFLGHGPDGRYGPEMTFSIQPGATATYLDVLASAFGLSTDYGPILLTSTTDRIVGQGQTWTPANPGGSYGQSVPIISATDSIGATPKAICGVRDDNAYRTTLYLANVTSGDVQVTALLYRADGGLIGSRTTTLGRLAMTQWSVGAEFGITNLMGGSFVITTNSASPAIAAYASVVDNVTEDPRTLLPR